MLAKLLHIDNDRVDRDLVDGVPRRAGRPVRCPLFPNSTRDRTNQR